MVNLHCCDICYYEGKAHKLTQSQWRSRQKQGGRSVVFQLCDAHKDALKPFKTIDQLMEVSNNLTFYGKLEAGKPQLKITKCDLRPKAAGDIGETYDLKIEG